MIDRIVEKSVYLSVADLEAELLMMETSRQGVPLLTQALGLAQKTREGSDLEFRVRIPEAVKVWKPRRIGYYTVSFASGLYVCRLIDRDMEPERLFLYLELVIWSVLGIAFPPRIEAAAFRVAERDGTLSRSWKTNELGVTLGDCEREFSKVFEQVDGLWRKRDATSSCSIALDNNKADNSQIRRLCRRL